ncbi:Protein SGT1 [Nakaseomyces bracarensis]|uniref:Protein SGT1 n=1 Tax=Nakaseomyces bracarensis TaxID=273131 RepID=A0ABR4NXE8_9SACH
MPVDKDLKVAYTTLYDEENPIGALGLYDKILKETPENLTALVYKGHALEKLYFSDKEWHTVATMDEAQSCLAAAEDVALQRGDRKKIGWVYFRSFVLQFNLKYYKVAERYLDRAKKYGYEDPFLGLWEDKLNKKLARLASKQDKTNSETSKVDNDETVPEKKITESVPIKTSDQTAKNDDSEKLRTDWYQSNDKITISFFTVNLPQDKNSVNISIPDHQTLSISYPVKATGSEFQFELKLAQRVDPSDVIVNIMTKKFEVALKKEVNSKWKTLEYDSKAPINVPTPVDPSLSIDTKPMAYPTSSKKHIDWSKIDLDDDEEEENSGSADAFFQQLYADADPDTRRAMMKSFIESNGTTLNTNWEEVGNGKVETALPEGQELKKW